MQSGTTYRLAENGTRFIALIIDSIIIGVVGSIFGANDQWFLGGIIGFAVNAAYQWYFLTRSNGQTPGKMLLNIRVIKVDGTPIDGTDAVLRTLGYYINTAVLFLGWLWAFVDSQQQGWHDKLARTYVVRADGGDDGTILINKQKNSDADLL